MCNKNNNFNDILEKIIILQQNRKSNLIGCNKPFLGNNNEIIANTRPLNLYCCCTNSIWTMDYTFNGTSGSSSTFRIESLNNNIATFRILINENNTITSTNNYFTINLEYISCIKCLEDTFIELN